MTLAFNLPWSLDALAVALAVAALLFAMGYCMAADDLSQRR